MLHVDRVCPMWLLSAVTHHEEGSSVVVLLEELVFAFGGFVGDHFAAVAQLGSALLLRQAVESLNFSLLPLHAEDRHHSLPSATTLCLLKGTKHLIPSYSHLLTVLWPLCPSWCVSALGLSKLHILPPRSLRPCPKRRERPAYVGSPQTPSLPPPPRSWGCSAVAPPPASWPRPPALFASAPLLHAPPQWFCPFCGAETDVKHPELKVSLTDDVLVLINVQRSSLKYSSSLQSYRRITPNNALLIRCWRYLISYKCFTTNVLCYLVI